MRKLRRRVQSPALVVSVFALIVALGGTGYAAVTVGTNQIKNGAVTAPKLAKGAVTTSKIAARTVTRGKLAALEAPHNPQFRASGWRNCGSGFEKAGFYKDLEGIVHLQGCVKGGGGSQIFVLPSGYRPPGREEFAVACDGCTATNVGRLLVARTGEVAVYSAGTTQSLDGVTFRAAG
jgi:hypothetical protein